MESLIYDGTFVGFLNLLHYLETRQDLTRHIPIWNKRLHPEAKGLLFYKEIPSDIEVAYKYLEVLIKLFGSHIKDKLFLYYLCDTAKIEWPLLKVIGKAREKRNIWQDLTDEDIIKLQATEREFYRERHRFYGLLRFFQIPEGPLIAPFEPKFNVLPKLYPHFVRRFPRENFIIVDVRRKLVFTHLQGVNQLFWVDGLEVELDLKGDPFISLWRDFFREIAVPERVSFKRQRSRVPLRVRKFLPEFW